jgi:hypothetical protein
VQQLVAQVVDLAFHRPQSRPIGGKLPSLTLLSLRCEEPDLLPWDVQGWSVLAVSGPLAGDCPSHVCPGPGVGTLNLVAEGAHVVDVGVMLGAGVRWWSKDQVQRNCCIATE